jgi:hypothetical protein
MMGLKEFAIPFGLIAIGLWVWLFWSSPRVLIPAFLATVVAMVLMYRNDDVVQLTFEPKRVLVQMAEVRREIFAKVNEVQKLAAGIGELTAYNIAHLWRLAPADPEAARLEERDRIVTILREAGLAEERIQQVVAKVAQMVTWDLASDAWRSAPRETFSTRPGKGLDMKVVRKDFVDQLLRSDIGKAVEVGRRVLQPIQAWSPEVEAKVKRFDEFRRTGKLPPRVGEASSLGVLQ